MNMKVKRRQLLVNKRLQTFFALQIGVFFAICFGVLLIDYYVLKELSIARTLAFSDPIRGSVSLFDVPIGYAMMLLVLNGAFFYMLSVFFSHRIAGPIINITRCLHQVQEGDLTVQVTLRKDDYLKEIECGLNDLTKNLQHTMKEIQTVSQKMMTQEQGELTAQIEKLVALTEPFKTE